MKYKCHFKKILALILLHTEQWTGSKLGKGYIKALRTVTAVMELKDPCYLEGKL